MADPDVQRAFVANNGEKRPSDAFIDAAEKARTKRERKHLKRQSVKQQVDLAYWRGLKDMALYLLEAKCWQCGSYGSELNPIDAHHAEPRGRGGKSEPENLALWCRDCHEAFHGRPEFSQSGEVK